MEDAYGSSFRNSYWKLEQIDDVEVYLHRFSDETDSPLFMGGLYNFQHQPFIIKKEGLKMRKKPYMDC